MEHIGTPRFFASHSATVRSVAFNPVERYLFASGGNDGNICLYHAGRAELLNIYTVITSGLNRQINAIRYTCDGRKILSVTTSRRLSVLDVEHGQLVNSYENCAFSGRDRAALAVDPTNPDLAVCSYVNGKGLTMLDLRAPLPHDFVFDFHADPIRDIQYLDSSWPFAKSSAQSIMTLSSAGLAKICALDGAVLHSFDFGQCANTIVATPEPFGSAACDGFTSALLAGGTSISSYAPTPQSISGTGTAANGHSAVSEELPNGTASSFRPYGSIIHRTSSGSSLVEHDIGGGGGDEDLPDRNPPSAAAVAPPTIHRRRSNIIFAPEGIRIRNLIAASAAAASAAQPSAPPSGQSQSQMILGGSAHNPPPPAPPRYLPRPSSYVQQHTENLGFPSSSAAAIRQQILNHLQSHGQAATAASSSSSSSASAAASVITTASSSPLRSNLQQFLAMNLLPLRSSAAVAATAATNSQSTRELVPLSTPSPASSSSQLSADSITITPSQVVFHDPWDQSRLPSSSSALDTPEDHLTSPPEANVLDAALPSPLSTNPPRNLVYFIDGVYSNKPPSSFASSVTPQYIWRLKYSQSGAFLYAAGDGGSVRRYRQYPGQELRSLGDLYKHRGDVIDMDISPFDEYLVTASKDKTVGLLCLGSPNHGWTEYYELS